MAPSRETGKPKPPPMSELAKQHFTSRPGYVNYYFNQLNQDRVWKGLSSHGEVAALNGRWTIAGELASGGEFEFVLDDKSAQITLPGGQAKVDMSGSLADSLGAPG